MILFVRTAADMNHALRVSHHEANSDIVETGKSTIVPFAENVWRYTGYSDHINCLTFLVTVTTDTNFLSPMREETQD